MTAGPESFANAATVADFAELATSAVYFVTSGSKGSLKTMGVLPAAVNSKSSSGLQAFPVVMTSIERFGAERKTRKCFRFLPESHHFIILHDLKLDQITGFGCHIVIQIQRQLGHVRIDHFADTADQMFVRRGYPTGKECFRTIHNRVVLGKQPINLPPVIAATNIGGFTRQNHLDRGNQLTYCRFPNPPDPACPPPTHPAIPARLRRDFG